jgi:hypothetical protein
MSGKAKGCPFSGAPASGATPQDLDAQGSADDAFTAPDLEGLAFELAPATSPDMRRAIEAEALRLNDRYLIDFIENHQFCPFARESRQRGETARFVVHLEKQDDLETVLDIMRRVAAEPTTTVTQVIFPLVGASPKAWTQFCHKITECGHERIGGEPVLAVAPLHPELGFKTTNPFALLTLFRRTPDPTIQWVRLDALDSIYEGRRKGTVVMTPSQVAAILNNPEPVSDLYDRIAETNQATAERMGYDEVVAALSKIAAEGRQNYRRILTGANS